MKHKRIILFATVVALLVVSAFMFLPPPNRLPPRWMPTAVATWWMLPPEDTPVPTEATPTVWPTAYGGPYPQPTLVPTVNPYP